MRHKYLLLVLTCVVGAFIGFLCLKTLFSVKDITVEYTVKDESNVEDVFAIINKYKGKSMFTIDTDQIKEEITKDRFLKVIEIKKVYPNELVVNLSERTEVFYYKTQGEYYYLDEDFFVTKKTISLVENDANLIEIAFTDYSDDAAKEHPIDCNLKSTCVFPENFNEILLQCFSASGSQKQNIIKAEVLFMANNEGNYRINLYMREGVIVQLYYADVNTYEKAEKGINYYLTLNEKRKTSGAVIVFERENQIVCTHTFNYA